jgi:hypothetical protein
VLESLKCDACRGQGKCNDADLGDISFKEWTCEKCGGTGCNRRITASEVGTLRDGWRAYSAEVLPKSAPTTQVIETRRAFYAGAWETICVVRRAPRLLKELADECQRFKTSVGTALEGRT